MTVTIIERDHVGAGSSSGNAGWIAPALIVPLPEPMVLRYGLRALLSPSSPVYIPPRADLRLIRFLSGFIRHSTSRSWERGMDAYVSLNRSAIGAYDVLANNGVEQLTEEANPFIAAYRHRTGPAVLLDELRRVRATGLEIDFDLLDGSEARELAPLLSDRIEAAIRIDHQRFVHPGRFVVSLAQAIRDRGGQFVEGVGARALHDRDHEVIIDLVDGEQVRADAAVVATGAWLGELAGKFGVRMLVQAGRGYSFSVSVNRPATGPIYFPAERIACTPLDGRLRLGGTMEFSSPNSPLDRRRIEAIENGARSLLRDIDWGTLSEEWVGSRPCTPDGLPLIGRTRSSRVYVAGGHGMWGMALGPLTGQLVSLAVTTGEVPPVLIPFQPLR